MFLTKKRATEVMKAVDQFLKQDVEITLIDGSTFKGVLDSVVGVGGTKTVAAIPCGDRNMYKVVRSICVPFTHGRSYRSTRDFDLSYILEVRCGRKRVVL